MMTFGMKLCMKELTEEEAARCVYAWLSVASQLHAKGICAADFRWPNIMKQQQRVPKGGGSNDAYAQLPWIPLIIDLEQARKAGMAPHAVRVLAAKYICYILFPDKGGAHICI